MADLLCGSVWQWSASYDVRISSADQSLVLQYYGLVQQVGGGGYGLPSAGGVTTTHGQQ